MIIGIDNDKLKFVADSNGKLVVTLANLTDAIVKKELLQNCVITRCKDCENHGTRTNMCDIWHRHTSGEGYCHRAKAKSKEQKAKSKGGEEG